jgi:hypothetical protein
MYLYNSSYESHMSKTGQLVNKAKNSTYVKFFNTGLIFPIAEFFLPY